MQIAYDCWFWKESRFDRLLSLTSAARKQRLSAESEFSREEVTQQPRCSGKVDAFMHLLHFCKE